MIDLSGFTGTEHYYKYHSILITDGVKYFAEQASAFWLIDIVWSVQDQFYDEDFVHITLTVKDDEIALLLCTDGDKGDGARVLYQQEIEYTDCPEGVWHFYQEGNVLLLPSEH